MTANNVTLGELEAFLKKLPTSMNVTNGFTNPHSYRGNYEEVAFAPAFNVCVGEMLSCVEKALTQSFRGYKGGYFSYDEKTLCHVQNEGSSYPGEDYLTEEHLKKWLWAAFNADRVKVV